MHHPKKRLGQHFLVDPSIGRRIVDSLDREGGGPIVEIGPGRGILTSLLSELGRPVFAVEKDPELAAELRKKFRDKGDVRIITGDILTCNLQRLYRDNASRRMTIIGNIPFQITSPLIDRLLASRDLLREIVLMIQKEVAKRLFARPGSRVYGGLTVIVNYFSTVRAVLEVKRGSFFPVPEVDATVIRMTTGARHAVEAKSEGFFVQVVRSCFGWRRKQMKTILRKHPDFLLKAEELEQLSRCLASPLTWRPERFSVEDFVILSNRLLAMRR